MRIGILGAGNIGRILSRKLAAAGHDVKVAHARAPEAIAAEALETGARATTIEDAMTDIEVAILSMPFTAYEKVKPIVAALPDETVVIDTANYFPARDIVVPEIEDGKVESLWVQDFIGRPITKAWNTIFMMSLAERGQPKGHPERIAGPVSGDRARDREIAIGLMNDTGFDGFDAGPLTESWRQQPSSPVYCTDLSYDEIADALAAAERERLSKRRELTAAVFAERKDKWTAESVANIHRALNM
ncbi:MAG: NADP oxidoreductase [Micavibrio aeruginosavorus]|uniref:NADP oxidoreductase n=1 Tax=Micavibrio aeruginosavorus TaxID=349221 RepID=A0A2W5FJX8_9BACT|nr:MAG: NADP oxidoreductase [Micavibrio aeruginosavorus]